MATQLQLRRGTTSQIAAFTGANGEIAVDTDVKTIYVQDGATAGGFAMARADFSNISASATLTVGTFTATTADINGGTFDGIVGGTTPAAGTFTTITGSGDLVIDTTTFVVDSTNNRVGVNTASPGVDLDVNGGSTTQLRLTASDSTSASIVNFGDQDNVAVGRIIYSHIDDSFSFKTNNVNDRLVIDSSGLVGLGTTTMSDYNTDFNDLVIDGGTNSGITIVSATTGDGTIAFSDGTTGDQQYRGYLQYTHSSDVLKFATAGVEGARLDSSGVFMIGTTDSDNRNNSAGSSADNGFAYGGTNGYLDVARYNGIVAYFNRTGTAGEILQFRKNGSAVGHISASDAVSSDLSIYSTATSHVGIQFGNTRLHPTDNAGATTDGVCDIGNSTTKFKDLYLSGGVVFPDAGGTGTTATANSLASYECGTWTPTVSVGSITVDRAHYTKIGRLVHIAGVIKAFTNRTATNAVKVSNLPFPVTADHASGTAMANYNAATNHQCAYTTTSEVIYFYPMTTSGFTFMSYDDIDHDNAAIYFFATYQSTS